MRARKLVTRRTSTFLKRNYNAIKKANHDLLIGFSKNEREKQQTDTFEKSTGYVEFIEMGRKRPNAADESIIMDIVNMDAQYDAGLLPNNSIGYLFAKPDSDLLLEKSRYGNFHTIDWLKDLAKDRYRRRWIREKDESGHFLEKAQNWHDAISGWFCVLLVAMCTGITAGFIDVAVKWMSNLKMGVCRSAFWLDREQCCWGAKDIHRDPYQNANCSNWSTWNEVLDISDSDYIVEYLIHIFFSLMFAFIAAVLVKFFAPYACGSGVPEIKTILSGYVMNGYLGKWTLLIKSIGMIFATSAGLALGKEGPMVHVACAFGNILSRLFPKYGRNEAKKREILSAAAATGVAVAFGAPIGGVLFSLEELSYYFPMKTLWRSFFCAMTGAFILKTVDPFGQRSDVLFFLDYTPEWYFFELIPFIFLGMLGGAFGCFFIKTNVFICKLRKSTRLRNYPVIEVLAVTLLTAALGHFNPYTRISMSDLIKRLVSRCDLENQNALLCDYVYGNKTIGEGMEITGIASGIYESMWQMAFGIFYYCAMLVITFGIKIPCGLFIPSLVIGSLTGRIVGMAIQIFSHYYPTSLLVFGDCDKCIVPGVYALIGACAFLGGATRMTVSMVVIMVELTAGLTLIVPLMVSAFTAKMFGELLNHGGIYDEHIHMNSFPLLENAVEYKYKASALDVMRPKKGDEALITLKKSNMNLSEIESLLATTNLNGFPIIVSQASQLLYGYVWTRDLKKAIQHYRYLNLVDDFTTVDFSDNENGTKMHNTINFYNIVDTAPISVSYQIPMEVVIDLFCKMGVSIVLVVYYGRILGTITRKDILRHLATEEEKTHKKHK